MTSACCCGTTRMALAMMMTTTMNSASVTIPEPSIASSTAGGLRLLNRVGAAIGKDQHRSAHGRDVHGLCLRQAGGGELGVPRAATIPHPRRSIGTPALNLHHLPAIE